MAEKSVIEKVWKALQEVLDPELYISIVDLGLVYEVCEKNSKVKIIMTLTTLGCPLFGSIEQEIREKLKRIKGITELEIELTFDPPWSTDRMSERGKAVLGIS
ncbi:hypothetical protein A3B02_02675 [Candidatus Roizmanbacteria bacterium RIFCSPLOWO2_01_FULL_42_14]|uniref:MIP18 family-like domain-containing protein n=4 Tax=Candidatus Roizmaniibacteriota TaxID=1752723 RepID=A0A1F7JUE0_9BACT|nr:MAG: hypothetical protein A3D08_00960 [Candidatus Roizmanbacteria bacterium RIFCSPHIGHO2_02_FULL_43_11]OGK38167.1 MAG: hypothetical protein A3F32_01520 [Candidatus Roizmanbacteria bacterium RIFCSPHIGHO2_12_FULL_42_10]OGK51478.1 MAG: hypothetical protein A3B02_02675 [Candidatus Roizmanbacteria bacterium RIFCSPLOWO2_01_FULL_42_14]OGK59233.1 MAG: hypothetical protein A3I56_03155 [Candidatus Roizmanbacteria bacterium RIFCSPLOWO2_02_FULL_43_10]